MIARLEINTSYDTVVLGSVLLLGSLFGPGMADLNRAPLPEPAAQDSSSKTTGVGSPAAVVPQNENWMAHVRCLWIMKG